MTTSLHIKENDLSLVLETLTPHLSRSGNDSRRVVLMTCGIAGSGKTTLSKAILATYPTFQRLSNDEIIASRHGIWGVDYDPDRYNEYQREANEVFNTMLQNMLRQDNTDVIIDRSLYAKEDRDQFKGLVERAGGRWVLVHFKVSEEVLWRRICQRRERGVDANCALEISRELFEKYVEEFEHPDGEGELVIEYTE